MCQGSRTLILVSADSTRVWPQLAAVLSSTPSEVLGTPRLLAKTWAEASFGPSSGLFRLASIDLVSAVRLVCSHRISGVADTTRPTIKTKEKVN